MPLTPEQREQIRIEKYQPFREVLDNFEQRLQLEPSLWWRTNTLQLSRLVRRQPIEGHCLVDEFVQRYIPRILAVLQNEARARRVQSADEDITTANTVAEHAISLMHHISDCLMEDEKIEYEHKNINHLTLAEICQMTPRIQITNRAGKNGIEIWSKKSNNWCFYPLPQTDLVLHKGGVGRTILKILCGQSDALIESELPPNDFDYIMVKDPQGYRDAASLGADPEGIEAVNQIDFQELVNNRDIDLNNAFLGRDGLFFSDDAIEAARSGKIAVVSTKRGIYGTEVFYYDGVNLFKNRGIMRLIKTVAENKARAFDFLPLNNQVPLGIYWLVLSRRFANKTDFGQIMDRVFAVSSQIGQVPEGINSVIEMLDLVHQKYPFYEFGSQQLDQVGVARWLGKKLMRQVDKKFRDWAEVPSLITLTRTPGDDVPFEVNLDDYIPNQSRLDEFEQQWPVFLKRCDVRNRTAGAGIK